MLDVRRLRLLCELSQRGTIAATARALAYTPSAVSQQLAALEREAGVVLFERSGRRLLLTPAAHDLVERARRILDDLDAAETALRASASTVQGVVRVGAFPSAAVKLVVPAARALATRHPGMWVGLYELDPDDGVALLRSGGLDVLVAYDYDLLTPIPSGDLESIHLLDDPVLAAVSPNHRLATVAALDLSELADERWVAGLPSTTFGALVHRACRAAGFEPSIAHRAREFAVQEALVAAGLGVALLPALARSNVTDAHYARLRSPIVVRRVHALLRQGSRRRPAVQATTAQLVATARDILPLPPPTTADH
jgi:DNA-binding transcriptional LysR family regulator